MPTIQDIRKQYPQYNDMSDRDLANSLYEKHYSDMPRAEFDAKVGMAPPSLEERANEVYGFDPNIEQRGTILPYGKTKEGKLEWAVPQVAKDLMTSFLLPGHVLKGGTYTPEDALKFTLDYTAPATAHRLPTGARKTPAARDQVIAKAPQTEDLLKTGSAKFKAAKASGSTMSADQYVDFAAKVENKMLEEGVDPVAPELTPKLLSVMKSMEKRIGTEPDYGTMQVIRGQLQTAAASPIANERRIASDLLDMLDDTVENILSEPRHKEALALWHAGKKSQTVEGVIEKATRQASGFENGIRIGFRQLLNNPKRLRGFTKDEIAVMKEIEAGTPLTKALRMIGGLGPKRSGDANTLRMLAGMASGGAVGGAPGAVIVPMAGAAAGAGAESQTLRAAEYLRALAASGGRSPAPSATSRLADMLSAGGMPVGGTQLPQMTQPKNDQDRLAALLAAGKL